MSGSTIFWIALGGTVVIGGAVAWILLSGDEPATYGPSTSSSSPSTSSSSLPPGYGTSPNILPDGTPVVRRARIKTTTL